MKTPYNRRNYTHMYESERILITLPEFVITLLNKEATQIGTNRVSLMRHIITLHLKNSGKISDTQFDEYAQAKHDRASNGSKKAAENRKAKNNAKAETETETDNAVVHAQVRAKSLLD